MSRRNRHGRNQSSTAPAAAPVARTVIPAAPASDRSPAEVRAIGAAQVTDAPARAMVAPQAEAATASASRLAALAPAAPTPVPPMPAPPPEPTPAPNAAVPSPIAAVVVPAAAAVLAPAGDDSGPTCTQAQLRRFIKSRPWIPMHELRRRFGIWGDDDDVSPVRTGASTIFVGLPPSEARMLGELLAGGDVGYELSLDPVTPVVVGVYPMRPVPRG
jgi:hypothetical protein